VPKPSHLAEDGSLFMVDVSEKNATARTAVAEARVKMGHDAAQALRDATVAKGDAFAAARVAGIMAAKNTAGIIPLAHPIPLSSVNVTFAWDGDVLVIEASARTVAQTGVEMEAMVAVSAAALTMYDMTKSISKAISIERVRLLSKTGGKSGDYRAV
jgi:cyclic pyranopterin phosphate synthase